MRRFLKGVAMRWVNILLCCLFLAFAFARVPAPLLAADFGSPPPHANRDSSHNPQTDREAEREELLEFCYGQRNICRKICDLRSNFDDRFDGCPSSCDSRESRCTRTGCYRWLEPEYVIAQRFGGEKCPL
jgi:hypothetical protein